MGKLENIDRRDFLIKSSLCGLPFLLPVEHTNFLNNSEKIKDQQNAGDPINFVFDGPHQSPKDYIELLTSIEKEQGIEADTYLKGGATKKLEEEFAKLTGKEKAIYMPSGTMANQLAIKMLNEENTKVIVPENSHIYRDEADAAQSVHGLRLVPTGIDQAFFNLEDLQKTIRELDENEVFRSGLGTVVIENPVRRAQGVAIPLENIKEISAYCKEKGYKMHLDAARMHLASAYTGVLPAEYSSHFDTVYISLYKYLNATGGAILCGDAEIIDQMDHQIKIMGGTMYQSWSNTAVALHYLQNIESSLNAMVKTSEELIKELNELEEITIGNIENGTNIFQLDIDKNIDSEKFSRILYKEHQMLIFPNKENKMKFTANASLLNREISEIKNAWKLSLKKSKIN